MAPGHSTLASSICQACHPAAALITLRQALTMAAILRLLSALLLVANPSRLSKPTPATTRPWECTTLMLPCTHLSSLSAPSSLTTSLTRSTTRAPTWTTATTKKDPRKARKRLLPLLAPLPEKLATSLRLTRTSLRRRPSSATSRAPFSSLNPTTSQSTSPTWQRLTPTISSLSTTPTELRTTHSRAARATKPRKEQRR